MPEWAPEPTLPHGPDIPPLFYEGLSRAHRAEPTRHPMMVHHERSAPPDTASSAERDQFTMRIVAFEGVGFRQVEE